MNSTHLDIRSQASCDELALFFKKHGLEVPAIFFLELVKPLAAIMDAAALMLQPFFVAVGAGDKLEVLKRILGDRAEIERLIVTIERNAHGI